jgi:hypothetical protein
MAGFCTWLKISKTAHDCLDPIYLQHLGCGFTNPRLSCRNIVSVYFCHEVVFRPNLSMSILYCDQYKIFLQLLSNQKFILFADDPLSGLDSLSSYMLVETFQRLVKNGFTIFCTLDQPSSDVYALFNKYVLGIRDLMYYQALRSVPFSRLKNDFRII